MSSNGPDTSGHKGTLIVTGGSRGIGAAVARRAARDGWAVAVAYSQDSQGAEAVARDIAAAGGHAQAVHCEVTVEADIPALFTFAADRLGPITGLVNNAGITGPVSRVADLKTADLERLVAVNVTGAILCAREAVRRLSTARGGAGGAIVNISSAAARLGGPGELVAYAATKGAIDSLTVGLAREVADEGIRVNGVAPGLIETGIHAAAGAPDRLARLGPAVPIGRAGSAEEVAEAVVWLLSPAASYVTGTTIDVTGGR
ncbi:SDR family oxidoreductase [Roseospira navarrensis]|uniref:SDR family oxidoreductase n=1 Tax=Roseospira navarrensis TaxID=140058 RepID=A0A7X1ZDG2_9PROT|nr:SDR family oxidoreductase [Roseospira navarrensis]MQX35205.1 SDR family oxidoreductase [Roseospira navarrensis]